MKVLVLKPFKDKKTKALYEKDSVVEMSKTRFAEATKNLEKHGGGFIKEYQEPGKDRIEEKASDAEE